MSDQNGQPLVPVAQRSVSADGSYACYGDIRPALLVNGHLDEGSDCIGYLERQGFAKPLVHLIDREGDFAGHIRRRETAGSHWLVRIKDNPNVDYEDKPIACKAVICVMYSNSSYLRWRNPFPLVIPGPVDSVIATDCCLMVTERGTCLAQSLF